MRVDTEADLGQIRHSIDVDKLTEYLTLKGPQHFAAPLELKQFGFGQSNPSYQIKDGQGRKYVLRKQPHGKLVSKTAHRVDREYYMLKALHSTNVPVPQVYALCQDKDVIGVDFYIMEFMNGRIFHDPLLSHLENANDRKECWQSAISSLVELHKVDPRNLDLPASFTRNMSSHYPRQLVTMSKVEKAQSQVKGSSGDVVGSIPKFNEIRQWLQDHIPPERVGIVHGDYKMDNLVFHPTENRVIAMLDWELCTIGHPLADLGNLLMPFSVPNDLKASFKLQGLGGSSTVRQGVPSSDELLAYYKSLAGWDPKQNWPFAVVFSHFRLSVIVHGIKARVAAGQASSEQAGQYAESLPILSELATREIEKASKSSDSKL